MKIFYSIVPKGKKIATRTIKHGMGKKQE